MAATGISVYRFIAYFAYFAYFVPNYLFIPVL